MFATNIAVNCRLLSVAVCLAKYVPFSHLMLFLSAINPNACRATGRGLQPKGVRVKEVADFKVFTKGAGSGSLSVIVKGPSEQLSLLCIGPHCSYTFMIIHVGVWSEGYSQNKMLNKMHIMSCHFDKNTY